MRHDKINKREESIVIRMSGVFKMKLTELIAALQETQRDYGDIDVQLQESKSDHSIVTTPEFFLVPEQYEDGWWLNLRSWPY